MYYRSLTNWALGIRRVEASLESLDLFATMRSTGAISVAAGRAHQGGEGEREDE